MAIDYNNDFKKALETLNSKQLEAVTTTEGPVLVIAGPGTGKTQILASRVGYILQNTDTNPENILCLTYTDAGTIAMRERLIKFIGPEAYRIPIHTFHSFCNQIIKENAEVFSTKDIEPISDLEKIELLHTLIDSFGKDHVLKRWTGEIYYDTRRLANLFDVMKAENFTAEFICQKVDEYIEDIKTDERFLYKRANSKQGIKAGDVNENAINKVAEPLYLLKAAANEFVNYENLLKEKGRYDYHDMIKWVIEKFKTNESLLQRYQEKFLYILVDEYQDTNGTQNEVLTQLINYWDSPNVFVVGDDDQSIYRFQGANIENIMQFASSYPEIKKIVLTDNYRSTQEILDASKALIEINEERLINTDSSLNKNIIARKDYDKSKAIVPKILSFENDIKEYAFICNEVAKSIENKEKLSEIAILYRNHKQCTSIIQYLDAKKIPYLIKRKYDILKSIFIEKIITILQYIDEEMRQAFTRDDLLYEILHFDFFNNNPFDIAKIAFHLRNLSYTENRSWRHYLNTIKINGQKDLFTQNTSDEEILKIKKVLELLEECIKNNANYTTQGLIEYILTRGGILQFIMAHPDRNLLLEEINTFFDFVKQETHNNPKASLKDILQTIKLMLENNVELAVNKVIGQKDGVQFITAHSSKGLEFDKVYIIGCDTEVWSESADRNSFKYPENIVRKKHGSDASEEERRLFYVAMTRAKNELNISYSLSKENGKLKEKAQFVSELEQSGTIINVKEELSEELIADFMKHSMTLSIKDASPLIDKELASKALEKYELSVTNLNNYLKCPLGFYFNNVLKIPSAKFAAMEFGSVVHDSLYKYFLLMQEINEFPPLDELLTFFQKEMYKRREGFTEDEYKQKLDYGMMFLPKYYASHIDSWSKIVALERRVGAVYNGVPIKGVLDKIEFDGSNAHVIDYKTGKYENARKKFNKPSNEFKNPDNPTYEEKYGGDYWRQALFYRILIDNYKDKNWKVLSTTFDFVEPDRKDNSFKKQNVVIEDEDIKFVQTQITDTYQKIKNLEFDRACNEEDCHWCQFVKTNYKELVVMEDAEVEATEKL
jgi:DNA helicase-2/ATP-dependent DNA helicase PcrA